MSIPLSLVQCFVGDEIDLEKVFALRRDQDEKLFSTLQDDSIDVKFRNVYILSILA
jgi:hypothetical protein